MLVSTRYKFVFLSNQKCASSSLVRSLSQFGDVLLETDHRLRHTSYSEYQQYILPLLIKKVGEEVEDYKIYCLFREPLDWLFSWYRFRTRKEIAHDTAPDHWEYTGGMTWTAFLDEALKRKPAQFANVGCQHEFVEGTDGSLKGLTLFRYDDLNRFLDCMIDRVGREFEVYNWNVSPQVASSPSEADYERCRAGLAADYRIYDSIPDGGKVFDTAGSGDVADKPSSGAGGLVSKMMRKLSLHS